MISVRDISGPDAKDIHENSVELPTGVVIRGVVVDEPRFVEVLQNLNTKIGHVIQRIIFAIPEAQCFTSICILPIDTPTEQIQSSIVAHAKTIIPINHDGMYIGHAEPVLIPNTNTQSFEYIAIAGDVLEVYIRLFEGINIELVQMQGVGAVSGAVLSIPLSHFEQTSGRIIDTKKKVIPDQSPVTSSPKSIQAKSFVVYLFLIGAFVALGLITYWYIIRPFL